MRTPPNEISNSIPTITRMCLGARGDGERPERVFDFRGCRIPLPSSIPAPYIKGRREASGGLQVTLRPMEGRSQQRTPPYSSHKPHACTPIHACFPAFHFRASSSKMKGHSAGTQARGSEEGGGRKNEGSGTERENVKAGRCRKSSRDVWESLGRQLQGFTGTWPR